MHALEELGLLDTLESESFDRITRMASQLLAAPVSAVSLTDRTRQWFKSHVGTSGREIPRLGAPCAEVTRSQAALHIPDMLEDERFAESPLAQSGIRFYAGIPLTTRGGHTLGAMCVLDSKPRCLTPAQLHSLEDLAAMVMAQIELQHEAGRIDPSSGLPNRHQLYDDIEDGKESDRGLSRVLLLLELIDLRHLNAAVGVLGASYLDDLLKASALRVKAALGIQSGVYQVGFASLALLVEDSSWRESIRLIGSSLREPLSVGGVPVTTSPSYGVSPFLVGQVAPQHVLRTAVSAAHSAREAELEYAVYDASSDEASQRRFHLLTYFRESLQLEGSFHLVYQPRLNLHTGKCESAEALLRWVHPKLGSVPPGEFIPLVEQTALARPMTQWVLAHALCQIAAWEKEGFRLNVSVNISARNLEEEDFSDLLSELMSRYDVAASRIELEFTESALIRHKALVLDQLVKIRAMGISLAIDDFGTGYSSLSYLHQLPANVVKLDQSFMRALAESLRDQMIVKATIKMAHEIGYSVVAEGVETAQVLELLQSYGCDEIQGYHIARPLTPTDCRATVTSVCHACMDQSITAQESWRGVSQQMA